MALGPSKGVLFRPVKDWRCPGVWVLREIKGRVRQYQLEDVTNWDSVGRFRKLRGEEVLNEAEGRIVREELEWNDEEKGRSMIESITLRERESHDDMEILRVIDPSTSKRAIEILGDPNSWLIQDEAEGGIIEDREVEYNQQEVDDQIFETIKISIPIPEGAIRGEEMGVIMLKFSTPKSTEKKKEARRVWREKFDMEEAQRRLGKIDEDLEMEDSSEEKEEAIRNKKGKGKKKETGSRLSQLEAELGHYKFTPAVPEVRNLFGAGTPRQGEGKPWAKESTQGTIKYAEVQETEDTTMEESQQKIQGTNESKWAHETQEEKGQEEGDAEMERDNNEEEEEEEEGSEEGDIKRRVRDRRSLEGLMIEIEVMGDRLDELEEVLRKETNAIWRGRRNDARMILVNAGEVIERGCYHDTERHQIRGE